MLSLNIFSIFKLIDDATSFSFEQECFFANSFCVQKTLYLEAASIRADQRQPYSLRASLKRLPSTLSILVMSYDINMSN